ncbi:sigma factor, partial [Agromyces humi]|uniref:sigma factor n=1 Tax=Agromyces humi TaxID=1766800 RepID=UPI0022A6B6FD
MDSQRVNADAARAAAAASVELVARASYGRLIALLAASSGDLALAEDALAGAFEQALKTWPDAGVPDNPEGWLLTVARNRQRDAWKSAERRLTAPVADDAETPAAASVDPLAELDPFAIGDKRLELLFVCAHPAIDAAVRTPLMLQVVLGFEAAQIARAFAVP